MKINLGTRISVLVSVFVFALLSLVIVLVGLQVNYAMTSTIKEGNLQIAAARGDELGGAS